MLMKLNNNDFSALLLTYMLWAQVKTCPCLFTILSGISIADCPLINSKTRTHSFVVSSAGRSHEKNLQAQMKVAAAVTLWYT